MHTHNPGQLTRLNRAIDELNRTIQDLWKTYPEDELRELAKVCSVESYRPLPPLQYPKVLLTPTEGNGADGGERDVLIETESLDLAAVSDASMDVSKPSDAMPMLLFIGHNPSTSSKNTLPVFTRDLSKVDIDTLVTCKAVDLRSYDYFKPIRDFRTGLAKYHIDLLALRHTNQAELKKMILKANDKRTGIIQTVVDFFSAQISAVNTFIMEVQPSQAVIVNACTRDIILANDPGNRKSKFRAFNQGQYWLDYANWRTFPARVAHNSYHGYLHSASMLSGQRAMDVGSRERLEAIVARIESHGSL